MSKPSRASMFLSRFKKQTTDPAPVVSTRSIDAVPVVNQPTSNLPSKPTWNAPPDRKKIIVVMGPTGAGKSSLIRGVTGNPSISVGHDMTSHTQEIATYEMKHGGVSFLVADTPGFDDTYATDLDILRRVAKWLEKDTSHAIVGIVYLHPIHENRLRGSSTQSMALFERLCGSDSFKRVLLATTFWDTMIHKEGVRREKELAEIDGPWKTIKVGGARVERVSGESDYHRFKGILASMAQKDPVELTLQKEMDEGKTVEQTEVGKVLSQESEEHLQKLEKLQYDFQTKLSLQQSAANAKRDAETTRLNTLHETILEETQRENAAVAQRLVELEKQQQKDRNDLLAELERKKQRSQAAFARFEKINVESKRLKYIKMLEERAQTRLKASIEQMENVESTVDMIRMAYDRGMLRGVKIEGIAAQGVGLSLYDADGTRIDSSVDTSPLNAWCSSCRVCVGAQEISVCESCSDGTTEFCLCERCRSLGRGCLDRKHQLLQYSTFLSSSLACCKRAMDPDAQSLSCSYCRQYIEGLYLHCCICDDDDFDVCVECMIKDGRGCHQAEHYLRWAVRPVKHEADAIAAAETCDQQEYELEPIVQSSTITSDQQSETSGSNNTRRRRLEDLSSANKPNPSSRPAASQPKVNTQPNSAAQTPKIPTPKQSPNPSSPQSGPYPGPAYDNPPPAYQAPRPQAQAQSYPQPAQQNQYAQNALDQLQTLLQLSQLQTAIAEARSQQEAEQALRSLQSLATLFQLGELQAAAIEAQRVRDAEEAAAALRGLAVLAQLSELESAISGQGYQNSVVQAQEAESQRRFQAALNQRKEMEYYVSYASGWFSVGITKCPVIVSFPGYCDYCLHPLGTQGRWECNPCGTELTGTYAICSKCHSAGARCMDRKHQMRLTPPQWGATRCRRDAAPPQQLHCSNPSCQKGILGPYFHCCACSYDDFDLCWDCAVPKRVYCLPGGHTWRMGWMPKI